MYFPIFSYIFPMIFPTQTSTLCHAQRSPHDWHLSSARRLSIQQTTQHLGGRDFSPHFLDEFPWISHMISLYDDGFILVWSAWCWGKATTKIKSPIPSQSTGWLIGIPGSKSVTNTKPGRLRTFISKLINNPLTIVVLNHIPIFRG